MRDSGVLDLNSAYAYLLLCEHFASTCLVARAPDGALAGFVAAYRPPSRRESLFVWQIGVAPQARRQGLASRLLDAVVARPAARDARFLEATVTPSNASSRALFERFAARHAAELREEDGFSASLFPGDAHECERWVRIGPLAARRER